MKTRDVRTHKAVKLIQALEVALNELESALDLQFDSQASLYDKLAASRQARIAIKKCQRFRTLIAEELDLEK